MGTEHSGYCRKEKEIAEIHADLKTVKKIVMGNGSPGLDVSVPRLTQSVDQLIVSVSNLDRNLDKVQQRLDRDDGQKEGKAEIRRRNRWLIGVLVVIIMGLIAGLISSIHVLSQAGL